MKFLISVIFTIAFCCATVEVIAGPAAPPRCFDAPTNHYWNAGTVYNPIGQCVSLQCDSRGQRLQIACPVISTDGCRKQPADLRKSYPNCCPSCTK